MVWGMRGAEERRGGSWSVAWFAFTAVFALLGTTALILPRLAPMTGATPAAASRSARPRFVCAATEPTAVHADQGFCRRLEADLLLRATITPADRTLLLPRTRAIDEVLAQLPPAPTSPSSAATMETALVTAGYAEAQTRVARPGDPAPRHSLIFAVPVGDGCYLGHRAGLGGPGLSLLVGQLPNGTCLPA